MGQSSRAALIQRRYNAPCTIVDETPNSRRGVMSMNPTGPDQLGGSSAALVFFHFGRLMRCTSVALLVVGGWLSFATLAAADDKGELFTSRVQPVFERRCISCHNQQEQKGNFSLETAADVESSGFVVPGDPEASHLLEVVTSHAGKRPAMPKDADPLTDGEVEAIRRWIASGAPWPAGLVLKEARVKDRNWWSWRPLVRPAVPEVSPQNKSWVRTPIDAFIVAQLQEQGLHPSPEADRRTLIRRLYFDLIGLPPSPAEVEEFVNDPDPRAYERLVDRLLASPRYGERWARHWLDVVHYGDTHGYDKDQPRPHAWPYRDYVIRAFNQDKPYSRFVQEQLAGDVLWPDTTDGVVATGFIAAGPWDLIGHAEVPESKFDGKVARNLDRDDMVTNTLNTFCSLTVQCARCHHHKLDAVTMEDYYRLQAVFAAIDRADRPYDPDPEIARRRAELTRRQHQLQAEKAKLEKQIAEKKTAELVEVENALAQLQAESVATQPATGPRSPAYGYHSQVATRQDERKWVQVDLGQAIRIDHIFLFGADEYGWADFGFPHRFLVTVGSDENLADATVVADHRERDFPRPGAQAVHIAGQGIKARYVRVTGTKLWNRRQKDAALTNDWIFALGELIVVSEGRAAKVHAVTAKDSIEALPRWGRNNLVDGVGGRALITADTQQLLALAEPSHTELRRKTLIEKLEALELVAIGAELLTARQQLTAALADIEQQLAALPPPQRVYAGTVHQGSGNFRGRYGLGPREIRVLHRGDVNNPRQVVQPGAVPLAPGMPAEFDLPPDADEGQRRVALAEWITHRDHPLTWRSIVNRVWLYHFGRGIVDTPNDFGRGGQLPTHPDLLDWLAVEFRDGGQSLKTLHRLICTSAVYRQTAESRRDTSIDSAPDPRLVDADNQWLWRMNRRRLTAEEIRDTVLSVAGILDLTMGGPGFQDFVIERPEHSPHYEYHKYDPEDPRTHRRAVYRFLVRSQPQPFMDTLDCADPSMSVPKREETLTSLQALTMLNNRFMVAMAKHFASRLMRERATLEEQLSLGFQLITGRIPTDDELRDLLAYAQEFGLPNACRVMLNLNEFVFVD